MRSRSRKFLAPVVGFLVGALVLCAGMALARAPRDRAAGAIGGLSSLANARAVSAGGPSCAAASKARRINPSKGRRRLVCGGAGPASSARRPLYWGATIGSQLTGEQAPWDMGAVSKFEGLVGKPVSLIQFFQPFADCSGGACKPYSFPLTPMESIRAHGSIPVLSWSSAALPTSVDQPEFQLADVIEGHFDSYLTQFAEAAKAWGHPFFLRFDWEMNENWMQWSEGVNGNKPGEFVAAWRHVHDIFTAVGATNATWVWCPYVDPNSSARELASFYPGDEYVDWTALDGYNWGTNPSAPRGWRTFDQVFSSTYGAVTETIAPSKPMMIGEMGSSEDGGSKAEWITEALEAIPAEYPRIRAMLWFDANADGMDWPIETSAAATTSFARRIQSGPFTGNDFANLPGAAIQPPA